MASWKGFGAGIGAGVLTHLTMLRFGWPRSSFARVVMVSAASLGTFAFVGSRLRFKAFSDFDNYPRSLFAEIYCPSLPIQRPILEWVRFFLSSGSVPPRTT